MAQQTVTFDNYDDTRDAMWQLRQAGFWYSATSNQIWYEAEQPFSFQPKCVRRAAPILREIMKRNSGSYRGRPEYLTLHFIGSSWSSLSRSTSFRNQAEVDYCKRVATRVARMVHYVKEIEPEWREVDRIWYADNSIEAIQEDNRGNRRRVMIESPHGDFC